MRRIAAPKDRKYLESLNLKALQKDRKPDEGQSAREFYQQLQQEATFGPLFSRRALESIEDLPELSKLLTRWLVTHEDDTLVDDAYATDWVAIVKWTNSSDGINDPNDVLKNPATTGYDILSYARAYATESMPNGEALGEGYYIQEIDDQDEMYLIGEELQNCLAQGHYDDQLGAPGFRLYVLVRNGNPHVAIRVEDGDVVEIKGKQNEPPLLKYQKPLAQFFAKHKIWTGMMHLDRDFGVRIPVAEQRILMHEYPLELAEYKYTDPSVLAAIAESSGNANVRDAIIANPKTPRAALDSILKRVTNQSDLVAKIQNHPNF